MSLTTLISPTNSLVENRTDRDGWTCCPGLSKAEAEAWLDWLETHGYRERELRIGEDRFEVRFRQPPERDGGRLLGSVPGKTWCMPGDCRVKVVADLVLEAITEVARFNELLKLGHDLWVVLRQISDNPRVRQELAQVAHNQHQVQNILSVRFLDKLEFLAERLQFMFHPGDVFG